MKQQPVKGRRAILIVTDNEGLNYTSHNTEVVRSILNADTVLNAIVVRQGPKPLAYKSTGYTNPDLAPPDVYKIAGQTGGEALDGAGKVSEVFKHIVAGIRSRYFVQYAAPPAELGAFRHIRVELSPDGARPLSRRGRARARWLLRNGATIGACGESGASNGRAKRASSRWR